MTNILPNIILLFLLFSCSGTNSQAKKEETSLKSKDYFLTPQPYVPELSNDLLEISGLLTYDDLLWGFNDSGGKNKLYGFSRSGKIKKEIEVEDAGNKDWESIAQDGKNIFVGDFGNNMGGRDNLKIYKIKKKDIGKGKSQKVDSKKIEFKYANQDNFFFFDKTTPFDCEAMVEFKGSLYIFSKNWKERTTTVYKIPTKKGEYKVQPIDTFNAKGLITGADINPAQNQLALVGYQNYRSFIWLFSHFPTDQFFKGKSEHFKLEKVSGAQTEGICYLNNDSILVSCERSRGFKQQVFLFNIKNKHDGTHQDK